SPTTVGSSWATIRTICAIGSRSSSTCWTECARESGEGEKDQGSRHAEEEAGDHSAEAEAGDETGQEEARSATRTGQARSHAGAGQARSDPGARQAGDARDRRADLHPPHPHAER